MSKLKHATIELSNDISIDVIHDIPTNHELEAALLNWLMRFSNDCDTKENAEQSFCDYINSKGIHEAKPLNK